VVGGGVGCVLGAGIGRGGRCVGAGFCHISIFLRAGFGGGGDYYRLRLVRKVQEVADHYIHQNPQVVCVKVFICCTRGEEEV